MRKKTIILIFVMVLNGCSVFKVHYNYSVNAKNIGQGMIRDVEITSSSGFWHETGYLSKNAMKGLGGPQSVPPNDKYTIVIKRNGQKTTKKVIDFKDKIKWNFEGDIIFVIDDFNDIAYELKKYR